MDSLKEIKAEFTQIYEDMLRAKGLPAVFGRIMATLLIEGQELSHKEISNLTGYSISSVSRTLEQMVGMRIVHKHKGVSLKHFVFHVNVDFPEMIANSMETMLRVYETQRKEIKNLALEVTSLKSKEDEKAEINRLQATFEKVAKTIEFAEGIIQNAIRELRAA